MGEKENGRARGRHAHVFSKRLLRRLQESTHSVGNRPWVPLRNSVDVADQFTPPENVASAPRNLSFLHLFYILNILRSFVPNYLDLSFLGGSVSSESSTLE